MKQSPSSTMQYKGYTARIDYDQQDRVFTGRLIGIQDVIVFHGNSVDDLETALQQTVDDYLHACAQFNQRPHRPGSGRLMIRVPPELHSASLNAAQAAGVSLNQWVTRALQQATG